MTRNRIEAIEHLNVIEVKSGEKVKRYEISAESGYCFYNKSEDVEETGLVIFPASWGLDNILANIEIREK